MVSVRILRQQPGHPVDRARLVASPVGGQRLVVASRHAFGDGMGAGAVADRMEVLDEIGEVPGHEALL